MFVPPAVCLLLISYLNDSSSIDNIGDADTDSVMDGGKDRRGWYSGCKVEEEYREKEPTCADGKEEESGRSNPVRCGMMPTGQLAMFNSM